MSLRPAYGSYPRPHCDDVLDGKPGVLPEPLHEVAAQPTALLAGEGRDDDLVDPLVVDRVHRGGAIVYAAFFVAVVTMPVYGGTAYDDNGYQPFAAPVPVFAKSWDVNITAFSVQLVIWVAGLMATLSG